MHIFAVTIIFSFFFYLKHISTSTAISAMNFYRTMKNVKDRRATANELRACIYDWCHSLCIFRYFCYIRSGYVFFRNFFFLSFFTLLFVEVVIFAEAMRMHAKPVKNPSNVKWTLSLWIKVIKCTVFFSFFLFWFFCIK